ncbi:CRE-DHS-20 protein [Aphelenchoides avenae]|nr:CRE-DHS-20 protein [Aphelenchus avenae]
MSKIIAVESYSAHFPYSTEHNFLFVIQELWQGYDSTGSDRLDYVVDAYYHAITARWPRIRYRCGWETMFIHIPITFLPTELEDIALHYLRGSNNVPACLEKN